MEDLEGPASPIPHDAAFDRFDGLLGWSSGDGSVVAAYIRFEAERVTGPALGAAEEDGSGGCGVGAVAGALLGAVARRA